MLLTKPYDRISAVRYARRWAFDRNPHFYDFSDLGGDCTSFISQCIFAGACQMNFTPTFGWYFISPDERSPSWSGVSPLHQFLTTNEAEGPFAEEVAIEELELGDVIQLGDSTGRFYHSLLVTGFSPGGPLVSAHTNDAYTRPLNSYSYAMARYLHLLGVRYQEDNVPVCPDYMF